MMEYTAVKFFIGLLFAWITYFNFYPSVLLCLVVFYASWHATRCYLNIVKGGNKMSWNLPDDVSGNESYFKEEDLQKKDHIVPLTIWVRESAYDKQEARSQAYLSVARDLDHYIEDVDYHCCYETEEDY